MSDKLGTAEWAEPTQYAEQNPFKPGTFWLGRSPVNGQPLGYADDRHICLVSGSRAGKGTTTIINNLCLWPGSLVVVDPKGENATVVAARRGSGSEHCEGMGQDVHVLDPFGAAQVDERLRSRFNPLDELDPADPATIDEAGRLADAIVVVNPQSNDPFWDQSARGMIKGLILHVLTAPHYEGRRNLVTIRTLITRGDQEGQQVLRELGDDEVPSAQALLWEGLAQSDAFNGVLAGIGEGFASMAANSSKQFESVLQVANRNSEFLDSPGMQQCLTASDFRLSELKTSPKGVSVFLSLPQRYMGEHFRWLRMITTLLLTEMEAAKGPPVSGHRVLVWLDEFAGLKRMEVVENAVAQIAGYGVKLFFVLQSLEQLKAVYKDTWETFLGNCGTKIFFGIDDQFTRKHISERIGETEVLRTARSRGETTGENESMTMGESTSSSASRTTNEGTNWSEGEHSGHSTGQSRSSSSKAMPLFLRDTASFFRALAGSRQTSTGETWGASFGTNSSSGGSRGVSEGTSETQGRNRSATRGSSRSENHGISESVHKRPLITPDEIGLLFARIDSRNDDLYPGLALVLITGQKPGVVLRTNYFDDKHFLGSFAPHPDHASTQLEALPERHFALGSLEELGPLYDHHFPADPDGEKFLSERAKAKGVVGEYAEEMFVERSIEHVWRVLIDTAKYEQWMAGFASYDALPPQFTRGTRIARHYWPLGSGRGATSFCVIGTCYPPWQFEFHRGEPLIGFKLRVDLSEAPGGTTVRFWKTYIQKGFFRVISFMIANKGERFVRQEVHRELGGFVRECLAREECK